MAKTAKLRITTHPGEILKHEFMVPLNLSARAVADALGVPANRITAIINGSREVTADTALRLAAGFGTTPTFWLNLQTQHNLSKAAADFDQRKITRLAA